MMIFFKDDIVEVLSKPKFVVYLSIGERFIIEKFQSDGMIWAKGFNGGGFYEYQLMLYKRPFKNWVKYFWKTIFN